MSNPTSSSSSSAAATSTSNDEAIARALARQEQEVADAELALRMQQQQQHAASNAPPTIVQGHALTCPSGHDLVEFRVAQRGVSCQICHKPLSTRNNSTAFGCVPCQFDVCEQCYYAGNNNTRNHTQGQQRGNSSSSSMTSFPGALWQAAQQQQRPHMCIAPCILHGDAAETSGNNNTATTTTTTAHPTAGNGGICVEMMVDTGAQTSVISLQLARQLGLERRIDRRQQGVAAGVGRARIVGQIRGVVCELGHVEFSMDFMVLDVADKLLLLGLDLMRRYKCIVNLERDVLVFGGSGGVEVPLLPAEEQHLASLQRNFGSCPMM